jgi:uncharacterized membrane protein YbhN (UPF0104 family)
MRGRRWAILRILISVGSLSFVLLTIGLERIGRTLLKADLELLLIALGLYVLGIGVRAVRWRILLVALGLDVPLPRLIYLYFAGAFFNTFLPTGFGGDVVRVLELAQEAQPTAVLGTVVVDRLTGLTVLFAICLAALPFTLPLLPLEVWLTIGALALAGLVGAGLILQGGWLRRLGGKLPGPLSLTGQGSLARAYDAVTTCGWRAVANALLVSLLFNGLLIVMNYLAARAVGMEASPAYFLIFVPVLSLTLTLPISIGGLGVREGVAVLLFTQVGVDEALAVAFSLAVYAINRVTGLFGGGLYLAQSVKGLRRLKRNPSPAERDREAL